MCSSFFNLHKRHLGFDSNKLILMGLALHIGLVCVLKALTTS